MDAQQQAQLEQSNAAKQAQAAPALTAEQMQQKQQVEAALRQQQEQLQAHINQQVQAGVTMYNLDVQRLTIAAQGLEACVNAAKALGLDLGLDTQSAICNVALKIRGLLVVAEAADSVSCETAPRQQANTPHKFNQDDMVVVKKTPYKAYKIISVGGVLNSETGISTNEYKLEGLDGDFDESELEMANEYKELDEAPEVSA